MIYLGADHGGFDLKEKVKKWLPEWGETFEDLGNREYDEKDDYPQFAIAVAKKVVEAEKQGISFPQPWQDRPKGILICRSAIGMVIAANKVAGAKAGACYDERMAMLSREHNDTNILALSADLLNEERVKNILKTWLSTEFSKEDRHSRRIGQIREYEEKIQNQNDK